MKTQKIKGLKYSPGKHFLYENRFVYFPPQIVDVLASIYGEGVLSLLVWLGKKAGWDLIHVWDQKLKSKNLNDLVKQFVNMISYLGWGRFIASKVSDEIIIIEHHSNIAAELESPSKHICYFMKGLMIGFGEYALYRVDVNESRCVIDSGKAKYCEYEITKKAGI